MCLEVSRDRPPSTTPYCLPTTNPVCNHGLGSGGVAKTRPEIDTGSVLIRMISWLEAFPGVGDNRM